MIHIGFTVAVGVLLSLHTQFPPPRQEISLGTRKNIKLFSVQSTGIEVCNKEKKVKSPFYELNANLTSNSLHLIRY